MSLAGSPAPYWPGRNSVFASLLTAVVTKTRPPQTIGDECAKPGIGAFQRTLRPVFTSQVAGGCWPSATPEASVPRKDGQGRGVVTATGASSAGLALGVAVFASASRSKRS